ncbi:hypothetical protein HAZT_HAZT005858 [Hyalella azteca]|uniref:Nuclear pore complex protein NUP96 C-terminal domain-containing protein n=1 Tax=Hyalella azteca TaxID=294128 RepID=A0A6A0GUJ7_HYAAZ|nr:hypothetical protein HAZT_HAZT005858 [Hyalella azteca]
MLRNTAAAAAASVPGEMFLDSFAAEPHEGASLGLPYHSQGASGTSRALQQLTANLFPMDEDYDEEGMGDVGDRFGSKTVLQDSAMDFTCVDGATAKRSAISVGHDLMGDMPEGRLSPSAGERTVLRPKLASQVSGLPQQTDSLGASHYRGPRSSYPALPSGGGKAPFPAQVTPQHLDVVPLSSSVLHGQHKNLCDLGAFMGRRSRVGWGPSFQLLHTGQPLGTEVDVVAAEASAREKRLKYSTEAPGAAAPYLFQQSIQASSYARPSHHALPDLPLYNIHIEKLHLTDLSAASVNLPDPDSALMVVEKCLREVLRHSKSTASSSVKSAPRLQPCRGRGLLHSLAAAVRSSDDASVQQHPLCPVFELCMALWGKLDYGWLEEAATSSVYIQARARVETMSQWLESVCQDTVEEEARIALEGNDAEAHLDAVFSRLTVRDIQSACELLQEKGDHHLALLLAQICMGNDAPRQIVAKQLSNWAECNADAFLSPGRLLLYVLAAGKATHTSSNAFVNVCKGLDWRRALAVHLWYVCPSTCTISEALAEYERGAGLLKDELAPASPYCQEPLPRYLAEHTLPDSASRVCYDVCYHLLKLYADPAYRLDQLLNPAAVTPDPLDVSASWLLMALIHSLGYDRLNPIVGNALHLAMAAHLESVGLWHWAVFVLMSLKEEKCRASEVQSLLSRHVQIVEGIEKEDDSFTKLYKKMLAARNASENIKAGARDVTNVGQYDMEMTNVVGRDHPDPAMDDDVGFVDGDDEISMDTDITRRAPRTPSADVNADEVIDDVDDSVVQDFGDLDSYEERESFIINLLKVPEQWINESKAILARSLDMFEEEAWYLIKAGDLDRAHKLLIDTIAPNAIINEDHQYLRRFIMAFEASSDSLDVNVSDWKIGGAVYAHYLHVLECVEEIKSSQQPSKDKVEALRPRLLALCSQLNSLQTPTSKHRLCVSEVSRVVIGVLRAVLGDDLAATTAVAKQIASLPLSKDCTLQELNTLTRQYLAAVAR